jgi:hypothetical protein
MDRSARFPEWNCLEREAPTARVVELAAVCLPPRLSHSVALWSREQNLTLEVLGVKGADRWRDGGRQAARARGVVARAFANQTIERYSG